MRTVDYSDILRGTAALAGMTLQNVGTEEFALLRTFHDRRLQGAWEIHRWPEICPTEQRTFRPLWDPTVTYIAGDERYDVPTGKYFQSLVDDNLNNPPTLLQDGVYVENSAFWAECLTSYSGIPWTAGAFYAVGTKVQNITDGLIYQCIVVHTSIGAFDPTKFGLLTPFDRYVPWDDTIVLNDRTPSVVPIAPLIASGSIVLGNGVDGGLASNLAFGFMPTVVLVAVRKPVGGLNVQAFVVDGTVSTMGFGFELSGVTEQLGYELDWIAFSPGFVGTNATVGTKTLALLTDADSVMGLGLAWLPDTAIVSVRQANGGLGIVASTVNGSISPDGFSYELNASIGSGNYTLDYLMLSAASALGITAASGSFALTNGVDSGVVNSLGLSFTPKSVFLTVRKPAGALNLAAAPVNGSLSSDGFSFDLNGLTDGPGYVVDFLLI